jgi:hypothetical protein
MTEEAASRSPSPSPSPGILPENEETDDGMPPPFLERDATSPEDKETDDDMPPPLLEPNATICKKNSIHIPVKPLHGGLIRYDDKFVAFTGGASKYTYTGLRDGPSTNP